MSPGMIAPTNRSPTETGSGAKSPMRRLASMYWFEMVSPRITRTIEGGMICPSVPAAAIEPQASPLS